MSWVKLLRAIQFRYAMRCAIVCAGVWHAETGYGSTGANCGVLIGHGVVEKAPPSQANDGAFRLVDGEQIVLSRSRGKKIFGTLRVHKYLFGYEAAWQPMGSRREYLIVMNGKQEATLTPTERMRWTIPYPLGTVVGPIEVTSCADVPISYCLRVNP